MSRPVTEADEWVSTNEASKIFGICPKSALKALEASSVRKRVIPGFKAPRWLRADVVALRDSFIIGKPARPGSRRSA